MKKIIHTISSLIILSGLIYLTILCFAVAPTVSALTYQNSADIEFTFNPTISISLSSPDLVIDNLAPGSSSDSNVISINVSTNAGCGYYVSATTGTSTSNTDLTSTTSLNSKFTNLSSNAATLSAIPDNHWGYSYSMDDGTTWISGSQGNTSEGYNGLPLDNDDSGATGVMLANTSSFTNTGLIKFKIAASAAATQSTGTYTNTVNFYAVANPEPSLGPVACEAGKICYNANSLTTTEGGMGKQEKDDSGADITDDSTVTLLASNFSRQGYGFAGWSDTYDYSGNLYGPQETITTPNGTSTSGLSLYAVWIRSEGSLQDSNKVSQICNRLTTSGPSITKTLNSVSALTDQRDGETYAIAKLADGNCWMIENLRLNNVETFSPSNTQSNNGSFGGVFTNLADPETETFDYSEDENSLYTIKTSVDGKNRITGVDPPFQIPRYNNQNTTSRQDVVDYDGSRHTFSYGNYYTWAAAVADTSYHSNDTVSATSLCPLNWKLPVGNQSTSSGSFGALSVALGGPSDGSRPSSTSNPNTTEISRRFRSYPNNIVYSGVINNTFSNSNRNTLGLYWSSTTKNSDYSYSLRIGKSIVGPGMDYYYKYYGYSIRCMAAV